jgi:hypothetical protein
MKAKIIFHISRLTLLFAVFSFFTLSSCEKFLTDFEIKERPSKIVLNAILYPDSVLRVHLSRSSSITEKRQQLTFIEGATVEIFQNSQSVGVLTNTGNGYYVLEDHFPQIGSVYRAEVSAAGFPSVYAETTIPQMPNIKNFVLKYETERFYKNCSGCVPYKMLEIIASLTANSAVDEYFAFSTSANQYYSSYERVCEMITLPGSTVETENCYYQVQQSYGSQPLWMETTDRKVKFTRNYNSYYYAYIDYENEGDKLYFSSEFYRSNELDFRMGIHENYFNRINDNKIRLYVDAYDKGLFLFLNSVARKNEVEDNPLAENVTIYSNVVNGLGVFGSISTSILDFEFDDEF